MGTVFDLLPDRMTLRENNTNKFEGVLLGQSLQNRIKFEILKSQNYLNGF